MEYTIIYGTFEEMIATNDFDCHDCNISVATFKIAGTYNKKVTSFYCKMFPIGLKLVYKHRKPQRISDTRLEDLEEVRLIYFKDGGYYYMNNINYLENGNKYPCQVNI